MRFKTDITHRIRITKDGVYYRCKGAVGKLSFWQIWKKTGLVRKVTCQHCRRSE